MDVNEINIPKLRQDLDDYFTSAMFMVSKFAIIDMVDVQTASPEKIIEIAKQNKFDLSKNEWKRNNNKTEKKEYKKDQDWFNNPLM